MLENKNLESIPKYYVLTEIQPEEIIFKKETNEKLIRNRNKIKMIFLGSIIIWVPVDAVAFNKDCGHL